MLIDTHCHLNFDVYPDVSEIIIRAKENGVEKFILPGVNLQSSEKAIQVAGEYPECFAAVGIHPQDSREIKIQQISEIKQRIKELCLSKKVVAVGEIGLDYYVHPNDIRKIKIVDEKEIFQQKKLFRLQMEVAEEVNLPIIIHCREAFFDLLPIVKEFIKKKPLKGVFHCFGGGKDELTQVLSLGFYIGFDGNITYKSAQSLRDIVNETPLEKILLETDSPFLTPLPHRGEPASLNRGERNEPKNVKIIAETVAKIKKTDKETIAAVTTQNARSLFNLK